MATEEITISELELADEVLADMTLPVDTATETRAVTLKQLRAWLGSSLPTGFIIPAVGKISDERFTLLDGKTLSRAGTYEAFCNKVVSEVQAGNWFACSEDEYAQDISTYGQCGKFVVSNDYVRIPTITRFIGATITLSEIGKSYAESLPNINVKTTGSGEGNSLWHRNHTVDKTGLARGDGNAVGNDGSSVQISNISLTTYNPTYQEGAKVQPDHIKYPYYMVISVEGQTANVEIDINRVYEDIELKANKSLSNLTAEGKSLASGLGMPSEKYDELTLGASGTLYTAHANGYFLVRKKSTASNQYLSIVDEKTLVGDSTQATGSGNTIMACVPVKKGRRVWVYYSVAGKTDHFRFIYAEGEQ